MTRVTGTPPVETPPGRGAPDVTSIVTGRQTARLRALFLVPFAAVIFGIVALLAAQLYVHEHEDVNHEVEHIKVALDKMYRDDLAHHERMLHAVMEVIQRDPALRRALARRDRARLLALTKPLFSSLKEKFDITHLYFTGPDRVNLLRVHQPDRYGDVIDRYTTLEAERTGTMAHGVELGALGTFTLRMVHPWYADGSHQPIGYVEIGMEIDRILQSMQNFLDIRVIALVSKEFLKREAWETGMRMLGRAPEWERFPDVVLSTQAAQTMPPAVAAALAGLSSAAPDAMLEAVQGRASYRLVALPLHDVAGRIVGRMVAVIDVSHHTGEAQRAVWRSSALALAVAGVLFALFWRLVGRIGRRIERDERELQRLATHDGLTGLYNHHTFYTLLEDEIARARRFNRPVSLLMLDIDHFKRVNDTHGHQAGDTILKEMSDLLGRQARAIDRVCRYGGEEITVILPETAAKDAVNAAERIRATAESHAFEIGGGKSVPITVSIGVATFPDQADTPQTLVTATDTALYAAKQGGRNRVCSFGPEQNVENRR